MLAYVVLDGFDLGVGILFPFMPEEKQRDEMMNSVAPVWDGNETWLVLGGGGLFAVFPLAYAIIMPALYAPVIVLLLSLVFRGVAFEFRWKTQRGKFLWDGAFAAGSTMATFAQGIALGALVQGIPVAGRAYAGGWWDWLTPFSVLTGVSLVFGYALLGATWLIYKTQGHTQQRAYRFATVAAGATLAAIGIVSLWTPFLSDVFMQRWFSWPRILFVAPVPALVAHCRVRPFQRPATAAGTEPLPRVAGAVRPVLRRTADQLLPLPGADVGHAVGSGCAAVEPRVPARGRRLPDPDHPRVHRVLVLGVPRQDRTGRRRLPLTMAPKGWQRLLWFVVIWAGSVAALGVVAWAIRLALGLK